MAALSEYELLRERNIKEREDKAAKMLQDIEGILRSIAEEDLKPKKAPKKPAKRKAPAPWDAPEPPRRSTRVHKRPHGQVNKS